MIKFAEIYGDSIMKGVFFDSKEGKYRMIPAQWLETFGGKFQLHIKNRSKFGCTIDKGEKMIENALEKPKKSTYALLEYGGNDCDFDWAQVAREPEKQHEPKTPLKEFTARYRTLISELQKAGVRPVIMSLPPIDAEKYFNWITRDGIDKGRVLTFLGDVQMIYRFQELYSTAGMKLAYETNSAFIDVRSAFLDKHNYKDLLCEDGIHPNESGHELIYKVFSERLAEEAALAN